MKQLPKINLKPVLKKIPGVISGYVLEHQGAVLTGGTIVCNAAGIAITYKNSPQIHGIIFSTRQALDGPDLSEEERKNIRKQALMELAPLVAPIIIFFTGSSVCAIVNQKQNEAQIAALTAGLTIAQNTISEYELFKEETRKEVGEDRYREIQTEVANHSADRALDGFIPSPRAGEEIFYFVNLGVFFSAKNKESVEAVMNNVSGVLRRNGLAGESYGNVTHRGNEVVTYANICSDLGMNSDEIPAIADDIYFEGGKLFDWYIGTTDKFGRAIHTLLITATPANLV